MQARKMSNDNMKVQKEASKKQNKKGCNKARIIFYLVALIIPGILYFFKDEYFYCYMSGLLVFGSLLVNDSFLKLKKYDLKINEDDIRETRVGLINYSISFMFTKIILGLLNFRKIFTSAAKHNTKGYNFTFMGKVMNLPFVLSIISQTLIIWLVVTVGVAILESIENHNYGK